MNFNFPELLATIVPQLGFGALFFWLFYREQDENKENIKERDIRIKELTENLIELVRKNSETMATFKEAVSANTNAMQVNNTSIQSLSEKISVLLHSGIPISATKPDSRDP